MRNKNRDALFVPEVKRSNKKRLVLIIAGFIILLGVIIAVVLLFLPKSEDKVVNEEPTTLSGQLKTLTDEEKTITEEILNNEAEIVVEGYKRITDEEGEHDAVVITVKNTSDKSVNFAFEVVALDTNNNVLDKTSLYAEGIGSGQTYVFNAFVLSKLSPEQMQAAHYEVYKAKTYVLDSDLQSEELKESE